LAQCVLRRTFDVLRGSVWVAHCRSVVTFDVLPPLLSLGRESNVGGGVVGGISVATKAGDRRATSIDSRGPQYCVLTELVRPANCRHRAISTRPSPSNQQYTIYRQNSDSTTNERRRRQNRQAKRQR